MAAETLVSVELPIELPDVQPDVQEKDKGSDVIMFKWGSLQKPFRCQLCDMLFEDGEKLKEHMDKHIVNAQPSTKPFPCKICPKAFLSSKSLDRHTQMHYGQVQKRCKFCYKVFANRENLERHILTHNGQKPHKCPQCNEQFVYRQGLETHMATHSGVRPFACEVCDKTFNRKDILDRHKIIHESSRKKYKCVECNKLFSHSFVLKRHTRAVHSNEFDSKECPICKKIIKCKENLVRHMKIHTGERPFACSECGRRFTQKQHVIDHMVLHTGGTPHQCPFCDEAFKHKRTLTRHLRKHEEHRPYVCPKCSMGFPEKSMLRKHMKKHEDKHYQCSTCQELFKLRTSLKRHKLKIHNEDLSDRELDAAEIEEGREISRLSTKHTPEKKIVVVVLRKDGNNKITTQKVQAVTQTDENEKVLLQSTDTGEEFEFEPENKVKIDHLQNVSGTDSIAQAAEKINTQVAMETEVRMAAGQQFEEAMEEERTNIIQTLIEYAEREIREANQKAVSHPTVENNNASQELLIENISFQGNEVTELNGSQSDAEITQSTETILENQSGTLYLEEAVTEETDGQCRTIILNQSDNDVDTDGTQSQIMIYGNDGSSGQPTIIIRQEEGTNNIIIEEVATTK